MLKSLNAALSRWQPFARQAPPEAKQSAASSLIALNVANRPVWTPRNYACLAAEGFTKNPVAYRCIRLVA
ncbi:MAG: hypothetical protein ACXU8U_06680, partial [Asticcacaulis sp.]